jgi:elongation factor Ts
MATITAKDVQELRAATDASMMDCKNALVEAGGDQNKAIEILQRKYRGKMGTTTERQTGEGRIAVYLNDARKVGAMIELRCETAPVAKNEVFVALANKMARAVADHTEAAPTPEAILEMKCADGRMLADQLVEVYGKLREQMKLVRCRRITGEYLASYVHHDGKSGVVVALDRRPASEAVAVDLCQHALFTKPLAIDRAGVPAAEVDRVRKTARDVATEEKKPPQIIEKIVEGKVNAFLTEKALMEQEHVKPDYESQRVKDVLKAAGVNAVTDLVIMKVGG